MADKKSGFYCVSSCGKFVASIEVDLPDSAQGVTWLNSDRTEIEIEFARLFGVMRKFGCTKITVGRTTDAQEKNEAQPITIFFGL